MARGTWQALLAKLCLWFCLWGHGGSSGCSHTRLAYFIHFSHETKPARGIQVSYCSTGLLVLQHPCEGHGPGGEEPKVAMYPGKEIFISLDAFESSFSPLPIPKELEAKEASVSAIAFVHKDGVSMVINSQVYLCFKSINRWGPVSRSQVPRIQTVKHPLLLCRSRPPVQGAQLELFWLQHQVLCLCQPYLPFTGWGYIFTCIETSTREEGVLLGIYSFTSFAVTGLLTDKSGEDGAGKAAGASVRYNGTKTSHMSNHSSATFHLLHKGPAKLYGIQNLALRGLITLWTTDALLRSSNNCLIMQEATVVPFQSTIFPDSGFLLVTVSSSQIAVLTQDRHLFYSSISQVTSVVHIAEDKSTDLKNTEMPFEERGWLNLLSPVSSNFTQLYDFNKHKLDLWLAVWRSQHSCTVEIFTGDFRNKICCIDMHENLTLRAVFVPKPGKRSTPLATVSSPHVLAFSAYVIEVELTYGGNTEYFLHIIPEQQHFSEFEDTDFCNSVHDGEMSTVTVDMPDNPIGCTDVAPLSALVAVSCPPAKYIRIVKNVTACDEGLIQEAALRNNFSYTISHNIHHSYFFAREDVQQDDLQIKYNFTNLACCLLVYYKNPSVPIFALWKSNRFQKHVPAEFVLFETNGMHNSDYLLTAHDANCISQPQNWTSLEEQESLDPHTAWTRRNYMNCKNWNGPELKWPSIKYHVLDGDKNNIFPPYNGLSIFKAIVVDTFYSYCDLSITFSGYVYGAFPRNYLHFWASLTAFLILLLILTRYS